MNMPALLQLILNPYKIRLILTEGKRFYFKDLVARTFDIIYCELSDNKWLQTILSFHNCLRFRLKHRGSFFFFNDFNAANFEATSKIILLNIIVGNTDYFSKKDKKKIKF